ncbi:unnamed protein product [Didymodactylos carnosus]|uniref:EGF-like domain-containing protein n=1 Tax=Didymodactylos carnosus TaxID=1234261 RepID=A0A8S2HKR3_9BILA|nr:unnamed protein product [Didymodactylos carnosus]CAF3655503.1 unnamed protein product [Didymodactylos carnosus]
MDSFLYCVFLLSISLSETRYHLFKSFSGAYSDYDCLYLVGHSNKAAVLESTISYCIRATGRIRTSHEPNCYDGTPYSFKDLKQRDIQSDQLFDWYASIDVIEQYQSYIDSRSNYDGETTFCNCSGRAFGQFCEYSFILENTNPKVTSLSSLLLMTYRYKINTYKYLDKLNKIINATCYQQCPDMINKTKVKCLDWREVCDGKIDCWDAIDESSMCFELERNHCNNELEYRCRMGTCISKSFAFDIYPDCMDDSDEVDTGPVARSYYGCILLSTIECEEHFCGRAQFSCNDGQCLRNYFQYFDTNFDNSPCFNLHDESFWTDMFYLNNLTRVNNDDCLLYTMCKFGFHRIHKNVECVEPLINEDAYLIKCYSRLVKLPTYNFFAYPSVQFLYNITNATFLSVIPDYICYDEIVCNGKFQPNMYINGLSCNEYHYFNMSKNSSSWGSLFNNMQNLFSICSSFLRTDYDVAELFSCSTANNFTCISKERLLDGYVDCYNGIDENVNVDGLNVCNMSLSSRFQCKTIANQCIPRIFVKNGKYECVDGSDEKDMISCTSDDEQGCDWLRDGDLKVTSKYLFGRLCDRFIDIIEDNNGMTDETDCDYWSCHTTYTNCDKRWNCPNAVDEINCLHKRPGVPTCFQDEHRCVQNDYGNMTCYNYMLAGHGINNCLGNIDERAIGYCHAQYPLIVHKRFHCRNSTICLEPKQLCNCVYDCPLHDDEELLCSWLLEHPCSVGQFTCMDGLRRLNRFRCDGFKSCNGEATEDEWFCEIGDYQFAMYNKLPDIPEKRSLLPSNINVDMDEVYYGWHCNRGLVLHNKLQYKDSCMSPPSYYGDHCEYQRKRLSIIFQLAAPYYLNKPSVVIKLIFFLLSNVTTFKIIDYEYIVHMPYVFSTKKYLLYMLYPKLSAINTITEPSFVCIDAYLVTPASVQYVYTWFYTLKFQFLPVQRLAIKLVLAPEFRTCRNVLNCIHGVYIMSSNDNSACFCKCDSGWTGRRCDTKTVICKSFCRERSHCIDFGDRPLCICALNRIGSRCQIQLNNTCDKVNFSCSNNGKCVGISDERKSLISHKYVCLCDEKYRGSRCENTSPTLTISINITTPLKTNSVAVVYFCYIKEGDEYNNGIKTMTCDRLFFQDIMVSKLPTVYATHASNCITEISWQTYLLLISCFISFIPQLATHTIFIVPSKMYTAELENVLQRLYKSLWIYE